jgi:hypothetical protein
MEYEHTQHGYTGLLTVAFMVVIGVMSVPEAYSESTWLGLGFMIFIVGIVAVTFWFSRLVVTVADGKVSAAFGLGKPHRVIQLSDITDVRQVRNSWIQGWGVRKISHGWMYNVWGLDAVELVMLSGKVFRIGTDEPERLHASISLSAKI